MLRRTFVQSAVATLLVAGQPTAHDSGTKFARAAAAQLGVTTGYDPHYTRIPYPNGDVPRTTGVCADVVVRAARDAFHLDLQQLVHEDMQRDFAAYPRTWGMQHPDANIDHRRVLNLEVFWRRAGAAVWLPNGSVYGNGFPEPIQTGDILTWLLDGHMPHVGVVTDTGFFSTEITHNIGAGVQKNALFSFHTHRAHGHFRWPKV